MKNEVLLAIVAKAIEDRVLDIPSPRPGPRGFEGKRGEDGKDFDFEEAKERIAAIIRAAVLEIQDELKLKFSDLSVDEVERLRGPRGRDGLDGRDGNNGRDFNFDEHSERIYTLVGEAVAAKAPELKLRYSDLTDEEKSELKLRFEDLTDEEKFSLRGARGARGQRGSPGRDGKDGRDGLSIRGLPGASSARGRPGQDGTDGQNGKDAAQVMAIEAVQFDDEIEFLFAFDDGRVIPTNRVRIRGK